MNDKSFNSSDNCTQPSRFSSASGRYFDYFDLNHSVFSKSGYYNDMRYIHPWSRRPVSPYSGIVCTALRARSVTPRLENLAKPKIKRDRLVRQEFFDNIKNSAYSGVKAAALTTQCSDHLAALAKPKKAPNGYLDAYILPRAVHEQTLRAQISARVCDLAKPRKNTILLNSAWNNKQK